MRGSLFICFIFLSHSTIAQHLFLGSFLLSFQKSELIKDYPMLWNIRSNDKGIQMAMEIQDEMKLKGVSKRIVFNPADSTWMMLMEYNKVKQGTVIRAAKMFKDTTEEKNIILKKTQIKEIIEGYSCKKIILESGDFIAEAWVTDQLKFNLAGLYKLLSHCGMASEYVRAGDWYFSTNVKGMILKLTSLNKKTNETYTLLVSEIKPGDLKPKFFDTTEFRISEIPEGQNCGVQSEKN